MVNTYYLRFVAWVLGARLIPIRILKYNSNKNAYRKNNIIIQQKTQFSIITTLLSTKQNYIQIYPLLPVIFNIDLKGMCIL